jgi:hypothetical protein
MTWITINDMYNYAKDNDLKLLSNYDADFWQEYITNQTKYDKLFNRMFKSFRYFNQDEKSVLADTTNEFIDDVYNHLLVNNKKYKELYKLNVLESNVPIDGNYSMTETKEKNTTTVGAYINGTREDTNSDTLGSRNDTTTNSIAGFNSSTYSNDTQISDAKGEQTNTSTFNKGSQTNDENVTEDETYTITRKGNDGRFLVGKNIESYKKTWSMYEFYTYIFKEISKELLLV